MVAIGDEKCVFGVILIPVRWVTNACESSLQCLIFEAQYTLI